MKVYKNCKGVLLAVFKNDDGKYTVYKRDNEQSDFKRISGLEYPPRDTRAEAEKDLVLVATSRRDKTYVPIDFKG